MEDGGREERKEGKRKRNLLVWGGRGGGEVGGSEGKEVVEG